MDWKKNSESTLERRNQTLTLKLTMSEMEDIEKAASELGIPKATYVRMYIMKRVRQDLKDHEAGAFFV